MAFTAGSVFPLMLKQFLTLHAKHYCYITTAVPYSQQLAIAIYSCESIVVNFDLLAIQHDFKNTVGLRLSESPLSEPSVIQTQFRIFKSQNTI